MSKSQHWKIIIDQWLESDFDQKSSLKKIKEWLVKILQTTVPNGLFGKTLGYL